MMSVLERTPMTPPSARQLADRGRKMRLVMADDDRSDQQLMLHAAEHAGLDASFSFHDDGGWLIHHLRRLELDQLPDLMLLDLWMPDLDGFRVLDELQSHPLLWQVPVLVLTSEARVGDRERACRAGASDFCLKPPTFDELVGLARTFPARVRANGYDYPTGLGDPFFE